MNVTKKLQHILTSYHTQR